MPLQILDAMARGGFEKVVALHDRRSHLKAFLAIHDTSAGPAFGGVRRWPYMDEEQAVRDVLRLARAMTHKCALAGLDAGGAKVVMIDHPELDVPGAYQHLGEQVEQLAGRFYTGPDVGTGPAELAHMAGATSYVTDPTEHGPGDLARATASGVFAGLAATLRHMDGEEAWGDRTIVIQGLGGVGELLAERLVAQGARVLGTDIDSERADRVSHRLAIEVVAPAREFDVPCDVFAPCAMGGILHDLTVKRLRARAVAGAANNVLARMVHGDQLHRRGVLYAPDFAINSGALILGALFHLTGEREGQAEIERRVGLAVSDVLRRAEEENMPTARVALREAERRIEERRDPVSRPPLLKT